MHAPANGAPSPARSPKSGESCKGQVGVCSQRLASLAAPLALGRRDQLPGKETCLSMPPTVHERGWVPASFLWTPSTISGQVTTSPDAAKRIREYTCIYTYIYILAPPAFLFETDDTRSASQVNSSSRSLRLLLVAASLSFTGALGT